MEKKRNAYIRISMLCMNGKRMQMEINRLNTLVQQLNNTIKERDLKIE